MKNNPWFRMYHEFATDPKVQMLSEADQRRFVMLLCLRCCNGDVTLHDDAIAFQLRVTPDEWVATKARLIAKNLIGDDNKPVAWERRQYVSDRSNERVIRHREKKKRGCNVTVTPPDTDTEEDTDTEVSKSPLPPEGASDDMPKHVKPVSDWSKAFSAEPEHETVRIEAGAVVLVNGTRAEWLARFGGDAEGLDLALIQVAGQIQPNSRSHSIEQQANRHLARIVQERRDRDRRYRDVAAQNAAKGNAKPTKRTLSDVLREQAEGVSK